MSERTDIDIMDLPLMWLVWRCSIAAATTPPSRNLLTRHFGQTELCIQWFSPYGQTIGSWSGLKIACKVARRVLKLDKGHFSGNPKSMERIPRSEL